MIILTRKGLTLNNNIVMSSSEYKLDHSTNYTKKDSRNESVGRRLKDYITCGYVVMYEQITL